MRKILAESAQDQRYIVTVRGTGYRFAAPVREVPRDSLGHSATEPNYVETIPRRVRRSRRMEKRIVFGQDFFRVTWRNVRKKCQWGRARRTSSGRRELVRELPADKVESL